jgi:hypothetical protein
MPPRVMALLLLSIGACLGAALYGVLSPSAAPAVAQAPSDEPRVRDLVSELETIKGKLPDQAHAMQDVGYHFTNLWFAGQHKYWELANFYWLETRSHLRWATRIIPVRKDNAGNDVDVQAILQAFENGPLKLLAEAIAAKDVAAFEKEYRSALEGCYACHKASDKPFIRLHIPTQPEAAIINFNPDARWPK